MKNISLRISVSIIGFLSLILFLYIGQHLLFPLVFATIFAFALNPIVKRITLIGIPRTPAIIFTLLLVALLISGILLLIGTQVSSLISEMPSLTDKFDNLINIFQAFVEKNFRIKPDRQMNMLRDSFTDLLSTGTDIVTTAINITSNILFAIGLIPVYTFLMLYYKNLFKNFVLELAKENHHEKVALINNEIQDVLQRYMSGMFRIILSIAVLNSIGLYLIGIKYALFFACLTSLLAIIPYFGVITSAVLTALYAYLTTDSIGYPIAVVALYSCVQFLEGNFITPFVMGSKVELNALVVIFSLLAGGEIWGTPGMILSVPVVAVLKMVCDNVTALKPFGKVLGIGIIVPDSSSSISKEINLNTGENIENNKTDAFNLGNDLNGANTLK